MKKCCTCKEDKPVTEFYKDKLRKDGLYSRCKKCHNKCVMKNHKKNRKRYLEIKREAQKRSRKRRNAEFRERDKKWKQNNKGTVNAVNSRRRAAKKSSTPCWADLDAIRDIYKNCPDGYHVDHIIPLMGETVCGLHVENNLQYLTAEENLIKGNNYEGTIE